MDPQALAQATVDAIKPLYDKYAVVINTMIRTNPDGVRTFVTRDVLVKALTDGAPACTRRRSHDRVHRRSRHQLGLRRSRGGP
jgi:hypothetical protein